MNHFIQLDKLQMLEALKGAQLSSIQTENMTVAYTSMVAGTEIPLHQHVEEAVDIIIEGELEMLIGDTELLLRHGMISLVPSNIPHRAKAITDCKVVTVFYPKRGI